jgi:hypothetical protein
VNRCEAIISGVDQDELKALPSFAGASDGTPLSTRKKSNNNAPFQVDLLKWGARPDLGNWRPSRLVATAAEDRLSIRTLRLRQPTIASQSRFMSTRPKAVALEHFTSVSMRARLLFTLRSPGKSTTMQLRLHISVRNSPVFLTEPLE